jgi:hypothetical protein
MASETRPDSGRTRSRLARLGSIVVQMCVACVLVVGLSAASCDDCCVLTPCSETTSLQINLVHPDAFGDLVPITDLDVGSQMKVYMGNRAGTTIYLDPTPIYFGGSGPNAATGVATLTTSIPKSTLVNEEGKVRPDADVTLGFLEHRLCSTTPCGTVLNRTWRYIPLEPPVVTYDVSTCTVILTYNTQKFCIDCF